MATLLAPTRASALTHQVAYLARRSGFGLAPADLERLASGGLAAAVDYYVDYESIPDTLPGGMPPISDDPMNPDIAPLQTWWLDRMIRSARPLEEKMTLFWHGLFATSEEKIGRPSTLYFQNVLFRTHALGDFQDLLTAVAIDPAMLIWLDGNYSTKDQPNENFARECMELFSIGIGNYTQNDVREGARSFTGWYLDDQYHPVFNPDYHDSDNKTFLGSTGNWTYSDITRILANHPACGRFLARKLWTFFAYEGPEDAILTELAGVYQATGRNMREVVRHMFNMPAFYSPRARTGRIKSPTEYAVIAVREFRARVNPADLENYLDSMGQSLFFPPNVGGWPSGARWLNSTTVVGRFGFAEWLLAQQGDPGAPRVNLNALFAAYGAGNWYRTLTRLATYHLAEPLTPATLNPLWHFVRRASTKRDDPRATFEALLHLLMVLPEYYCA